MSALDEFFDLVNHYKATIQRTEAERDAALQRLAAVSSWFDEAILRWEETEAEVASLRAALAEKDDGLCPAHGWAYGTCCTREAGHPEPEYEQVGWQTQIGALYRSDTPTEGSQPVFRKVKTDG